MPRKTPRSAAESASTRGGFNEAAARCRGKLAMPWWTRSKPSCFYEAAARCRGKHFARPRTCGRGQLASMRPRPDAAENMAAVAEDYRGLMLQ